MMQKIKTSSYLKKKCSLLGTIQDLLNDGPVGAW